MNARALALITAVALAALPAVALAQDSESPAPEAEATAAAAVAPGEVTAAALAELVPDEIAGMPLIENEFAAATILANVASDALLFELAEIAQVHDAELNGLGIAGGTGQDGEAFISVIAGSIPGVPADALQDALVEVVIGVVDPELTTTEAVVGRDTTVLRATAEATAADKVYVVPVGEVVWLVIADPVSLEAALELLPTE